MSRAQHRTIAGIPDEVTNRGDLLTRDEAVAILGIKPQTLYCYVSRGFIRRVPQSDGRSSFYLREDVENVRAKSAARSGHGPAAASAMRWGEPVIGTGITEITEQGPRYRNRLATELARSRFGFENIAEFLWGGDLAEEPVRWRRVDPPDGFTRALAEASALHPRPHLLQLLTMACTALGIAEGSRRERIQSGATPVQAARRLIRTLTGTFGFPGPLRAFVDLEDGEPIAEGLLRAMDIAASPERTRALNAALVLVADHERRSPLLHRRGAPYAAGNPHRARLRQARAGFCRFGAPRTNRFASAGDARSGPRSARIQSPALSSWRSSCEHADRTGARTGRREYRRAPNARVARPHGRGIRAASQYRMRPGFRCARIGPSGAGCRRNIRAGTLCRLGGARNGAAPRRIHDPSARAFCQSRAALGGTSFQPRETMMRPGPQTPPDRFWRER